MQKQITIKFKSRLIKYLFIFTTISFLIVVAMIVVASTEGYFGFNQAVPFTFTCTFSYFNTKYSFLLNQLQLVYVVTILSAIMFCILLTVELLWILAVLKNSYKLKATFQKNQQIIYPPHYAFLWILYLISCLLVLLLLTPFSYYVAFKIQLINNPSTCSVTGQNQKQLIALIILSAISFASSLVHFGIINILIYHITQAIDAAKLTLKYRQHQVKQGKNHQTQNNIYQNRQLTNENLLQQNNIQRSKQMPSVINHNVIHQQSIVRDEIKQQEVEIEPYKQNLRFSPLKAKKVNYYEQESLQSLKQEQKQYFHGLAGSILSRNLEQNTEKQKENNYENYFKVLESKRRQVFVSSQQKQAELIAVIRGKNKK